MTGWVSIHLVCQGPSFLFAAIKSWNCMRTPTLEGEDQVRKDLTDGIVTKWTANAWMVWIHFACSMLLVVRLTWPEHRNWLSKKSCHRTRLGSVSLNTFHNFHRCCYYPFPGFYFRRISDWFKESWRERWNQSLWHIRESLQMFFFFFFGCYAIIIYLLPVLLWTSGCILCPAHARMLETGVCTVVGMDTANKLPG